MCTARTDCKRSLTFAKVPRSVIRGGSISKRLPTLLACALAALAVAVPATAGAQSAVDEYTLDVPQAGSGGGADPSDPSASASGDAAGTTGTTGGSGGATGASGGGDDALTPAQARERRQERREDDNVSLGEIHDGKTSTEPLHTTSRSFPEVIADTATDGPMLPIIAALVLITAVGAWRVLRGRGTLSGQAG
jgi:hypothetical protein